MSEDNSESVPNESRLAELIRAGRPAIGLWTTLTDPGIATIFGAVGVDWLMVDTEHNPFTEAEVQGMVLACRPWPMSCIVRVRGNDPAHIKWVLDTGADGVIVPMIRSKAEAQCAVDAAKYHPVGRRGYSPLRATDFWASTNTYNATANERVLLICMIEQPEAVSEIDAIARMPGIDGLFIGPQDLAHAMGHLQEPAHPDVKGAIDHVIETANRHGKPWGIPTGDETVLADCVRRGGTVMTFGSSSNLLTQIASPTSLPGRSSPPLSFAR